MMLAADAVFSTDLPLPGRRQGKVRDVYTLPGRTPPALLVVATDRVSAFDVVMPTPMPGKGRLLTQVSLVAGVLDDVCSPEYRESVKWSPLD